MIRMSFFEDIKKNDDNGIVRISIAKTIIKEDHVSIDWIWMKKGKDNIKQTIAGSWPFITELKIYFILLTWMSLKQVNKNMVSPIRPAIIVPRITPSRPIKFTKIKLKVRLKADVTTAINPNFFE